MGCFYDKVHGNKRLYSQTEAETVQQIAQVNTPSHSFFALGTLGHLRSLISEFTIVLCIKRNVLVMNFSFSLVFLHRTV